MQASFLSLLGSDRFCTDNYGMFIMTVKYRERQRLRNLFLSQGSAARSLHGARSGISPSYLASAQGNEYYNGLRLVPPSGNTSDGNTVNMCSGGELIRDLLLVLSTSRPSGIPSEANHVEFWTVNSTYEVSCLTIVIGGDASCVGIDRYRL